MSAGVVLALALAGGPPPEHAFESCRLSPETLPPGAPRFAAFPAPLEPAFRRARVRIDTRDARLFRTQLRAQARLAPDFAGHYRVARWGCGAGCLSFAVTDQRTGRVTFPPGFRTVSQVAASPLDRELHRLDSRLLIVTGLLDERPETLGARFYEMTPGGLRLVKRLDYAALCGG